MIWDLLNGFTTIGFTQTMPSLGLPWLDESHGLLENCNANEARPSVGQNFSGGQLYQQRGLCKCIYIYMYRDNIYIYIHYKAYKID